MTYPISILGTPELRKVAEQITPEYPDIQNIIKNMWDTMYASDGVGLAAPQVGKSISLFVVDASSGADEEPSLQDFRKVFINPEIYDSSDKAVHFNEGCLSLPGIHEDVLRPVTISMRYLDENFEPCDETFTGFAARVIQHEYDHLQGKVFTDHLSPLRKSLLKGKIMGLAKGKFKASYKFKLPK
ncbi:MAG: peptide deformylase [Rikenellaceae bacterium]